MFKLSKMSTSVLEERPASEGDQIKNAIRYLFESSRTGAFYDETHPLKALITNVNGKIEATLCLCKHPVKHGAVIMWYE
jgi:hypothetical protein